MSTASFPDVDIISRLEMASGATMSRAAAEAILLWQFSESAKQEMRELREKNSEDSITPEELARLDSYRKVAQLLDMMRAQARLVLRDEANSL